MEESYNKSYSINNILKPNYETIKNSNFSHIKYKTRIEKAKIKIKEIVNYNENKNNNPEKIIFN